MVEKWAVPLQTCCFIPQRYILGMMSFLAVVNAYTMRNCLSLTITEMVKGKTTVAASQTHDWSESHQGLILGAFYWGYVCTHIPGGILADRRGGKYTLSLGILSTALFTLLTPIVVDYGGGQALFVLRILEGLGEGTTFPAINVLLAHWIPKKDRSKFSSIVLTGSQIGTVVANLASGYLIQATGQWSTVFYVFGFTGILWFLAWQVLCFSEPSTHPYIRDKEKEYLVNELTFVRTAGPIPWYGIWTSAPVWALIVGHIGHDWIFYAMVSDLPKYLKEALDLNVAQNGLLSALPYISMWISSLICGFVADVIIQRKCCKVVTVRKVFTTIGAVLPGIFVVVASYMERDVGRVITVFCIAMATMGPYYAGMRVNALDITTNYAGLVMGIENGLGALSGIATPYIIGHVIQQEGDKLMLWRMIFYYTLGVCAVTSVVYIIFAKGDVQYWNNPDTYKATRDSQKAAKLEKKEAKMAAKEQAARAKAERARARQGNTA